MKTFIIITKIVLCCIFLKSCITAGDFSPGNIGVITTIERTYDKESLDTILNSIAEEGKFAIPDKWKGKEKLVTYDHLDTRFFFLEADSLFKEEIYGITIGYSYAVQFIFDGESWQDSTNKYTKKEREKIRRRVKTTIIKEIKIKGEQLQIKEGQQ